MVIYKSIMAGPYHNEKGLPCQDSFAISNSESFFVIAVADGLGSERYSDIGSRLASQTAVEYCAKHVAVEMTYEEIKKVMTDALVNANEAVLERADMDGNDSDEYDTTLCLSIYDGAHLYYAQSGDSGLVALLESGEYRRITDQQRDEEGRVFPLCFGPEKWEFGYVDTAVSAFMLMTDGVFEQICPKMLRSRDIDINIPLARRFLDRFDCTEEDVPEMEKALYDYLENFPRNYLDDDKTMVVLVNPDRIPKEKDEAYYAIPDWISIRNEAEKKLFINVSESGSEESDDTEANDLDDNLDLTSNEITAFVISPDTKEDSPDDKHDTSFKKLLSDKIQNGTDSNHKAAEITETASTKINREKKTKFWAGLSTSGFNALAFFAILSFSLFAWLAKKIIEEHLAISALGVLVVCFLANASILMPSSSVLIVVEYSLLINSLLVAVCGAFGAALGEMTGFFAGRCGKEVISERLTNMVKTKLQVHKYMMVFIFSALPLPVFDIIGILSGAMKMNAIKFFSVCFCGKLIKMLCYVWLAHELLPLIR